MRKAVHKITDYNYLNTDTQTVSVAQTLKLSVLAKDVRTQSINLGWNFMPGEQCGAENPQFTDADWRNVDLPHDYSIEQPFTETGEAESGYLPGGVGWYRKRLLFEQELKGKRIRINFDGIYMDATIYLNGQKIAVHPYGYTPFSADISTAIRFGEENLLAVRVNHQIPSSRWYSGSGIYRNVDLVITDPMHIADNGVKITAPQINKYSGSGVLQLAVETFLENESNNAKVLTLKHTLKTKTGECVLGETSAQVHLNAGSESKNKILFDVNSPGLWSITDPQLYILTTEISANGKILDRIDTVTGFRRIEFDPDTGFALNGVKMKLKGVAMHHDQGALGAKAYRRAIERQIEILQEMGANTIRVTHNPASRDLVELANEKGILLIEEIFDGWHYPKNGNYLDYARFFEQLVPDNTGLKNVAAGSTWAQFDLETVLRRDFNAPSVIMWSLGNEIGEGTGGVREDLSSYRQQQKNLIKWAQNIDATRPVTRGDNKIKVKQPAALELMEELVEAGGVAGLNYVDQYVQVYDELHRQYPHWSIYASETASSVNSRGFYARTCENGKSADKKLSSYDASYVSWGSEAARSWYNTITRDFLAGEMVWTGFDYLGEPTPWNGINAGAQGSWPAPKNSYFGIIDTAGFPKDSYYFYRSQWNRQASTLHILPAWNAQVVAKNGAEQKVPVVVYSNASKVSLYFTPNGGERKLIGVKEFSEKTTPLGYKYQIYEGSDKSEQEYKNLYLTWEVPYADGMLEAFAYDRDGKEITQTFGRNKVRTAGAPEKLEVKVDRRELQADSADLAYIDVTITDANGTPVPDAENEITFSADGTCTVVGTDNGEQADHTSYLSAKCKAFAGKVLGIIKSGNVAGECEVKISAPGFASRTLLLETKQCKILPDNRVIAYRYPRNCYLRAGARPRLPAQIEALFRDGSAETVAVDWEPISAEQCAVTGCFRVCGVTAPGDKVYVNITVLGDAVAVLNYSQLSLSAGLDVLPSARPAVLADGTVLDLYLPVEWEKSVADCGTESGNTIIHGRVTVFGKEIPVNAVIRRAETELCPGVDLAGGAATVESRSVPDPVNLQSGIPGTENTVSQILFGYDTQQEFSEFEICLRADDLSEEFKQGEVRFYLSESEHGPWEQVQVATKIESREKGVQTHTYRLVNPVRGTWVKAVQERGCREFGSGTIGLQQLDRFGIRLKGVQYKAPEANAVPGFAQIRVNGKRIDAEVLESWQYFTVAQEARVEFEAKGNSAITLLPEFAGVVRLIAEAEDHVSRSVFRIFLQSE